MVKFCIWAFKSFDTANTVLFSVLKMVLKCSAHGMCKCQRDKAMLGGSGGMPSENILNRRQMKQFDSWSHGLKP